MLIIADDYTGAADAAAGAAESGLSAEVLLDTHGPASTAEVIALDLDTRHRSPYEAATRVRTALGGLGHQPFVFKKIDSTLRGQIGAELQALFRARPGHMAPMLIASAVPENGRTVVDGQILVRGEPLKVVDVWRGDSAPRLSARPRELWRHHLYAQEIHLSTVRKGVDALRARLLELHTLGVEAVVLDSTTADDLAIIARTARSFETMPLCVGAAGFARALGQTIVPYRSPPHFRRAPIYRPLLFAIASQSATARAQIAQLRSRSDVTVIETHGSATSNAPRVTSALLSSLHVLLITPTFLGGQLSRGPAQDMAELVALVADRTGAVIASGGDIARGCLQQLRHSRIQVAGELAPGVVLGYPPARQDFAFVSKAGDFGDPYTLSNCIGQLTNPDYQ